MTHNPPVEVVLSDGKTVLVAESMLLPSKQGYRVLTAKDFRQGLVNDPIQMARLVPPMITKGKKERTTEKKSAYNFVQNELEKSEIRGVLEYALALLISKGEEGITLRSLSSEHFGADKAGTDPDRTVRALRAFGAVINTERDGDNTRYILEAPPTPKSTEQRTREALVSMLVKALKRAGRVEENGSLTESESTTRDTKFGRMIREVSDNVDFLGGKDANVHSAMHIYGHAKGGPDLRSNGVLGDHNTNHQDEVGALNF
jgi:hypothetical protein